MRIFSFLTSPLKSTSTGDDSPASSVFGYVWRMTGWHQVWACLMALGVAALGLAPIELQRRIVNEVVESQNVPLLVQFGIAYLVILLCHQLLKFLLHNYQGWMSESTSRYTRAHLLEIYGESEGVNKDNNGRVVSIIGSEVEKLGGFVGSALSNACSDVALLLGVLIYMLVVEPMIALFAIGFMIPQIVITPLLQKLLNRLVEERVAYLREVSDEVAALEGPMKDGLREKLAQIFDNRLKFNLIKFTMKSFLNIFNALGPLSVLILGGYMVMMGETQVGVIVAFISGFERIADPVRALVGFYRVAAMAEVQHSLVAKWLCKISD